MNEKNVEVLNENEETANNQEIPKDEKKPKNKNSKKWLIGILIILVLCGLGYGTYWYMNQPKPTTKKVDNTKKEVKSSLRMSGNSLEDFDLYFLKLENETKNKVYSPLSIKYALEMLSEGSSGNTKKQIDAIIGDYKSNSYPNNEHMSFANAMFIRDTFKNAIKENYITNLQSKYKAEVILDQFASPDNINNWVSNKTFNLVNNLVNDVTDNNFFLINALAIDMNWNNEIHCESNHKIPCIGDGIYKIGYAHEKLDDDATKSYGVTDYPYSSESNFYGDSYQKHEFNGQEFIKGGDILADFNKYDIIKEIGEDNIRTMITPEYEAWLQTEDGKSAVQYNPETANVEASVNKFIEDLKANYGKSAISTDFLLYDDDNVKSFSKDLQTYDGKTLQYVGIMPKNTELTDFIKNTNKEELNKIITGLKQVDISSFEEGYATRIRGFIPFFKFEYELKLKQDLEELGIKDVFNQEKADLTNITESKGTFIDKAIHKANIEFSNDGIKASAATAFGGYGSTSGPYFEHLFKVPVKDIDISFNKPYMYFVRDKETGEIWFTGTVYEPIKKEQ